MRLRSALPIIRRGALVTALGVGGAVLSPPSAASASGQEPSIPLLVSPAAGAGVNGGPGQLFTVQSSDPQGDTYKATIRVLQGTSVVRTFDTAYAKSGDQATGSPTLPVPEGTYSWTARAIDLGGNGSVEATPQTFTVNKPPNVGAGQVSGGVTFADPGQPGLLQTCATTSFTIDDTLTADVPAVSNGIVLNVSGSEYAGPFVLTGTGIGDCANAVAGSGTLSLHVEGSVPNTGSSLTCDVAGTFARVLSDVSVAVSGTCRINGFTVGNVNFRGQTEFRPDPGQGLTTEIHHATFAGYFTVTPG